MSLWIQRLDSRTLVIVNLHSQVGDVSDYTPTSCWLLSQIHLYFENKIEVHCRHKRYSTLLFHNSCHLIQALSIVTSQIMVSIIPGWIRVTLPLQQLPMFGCELSNQLELVNCLATRNFPLKPSLSSPRPVAWFWLAKRTCSYLKRI